MQKPYGNKAYHQTSITTASKEKILLMLYEGCIRYFKKCKIAMEAGNLPEKGEMLGKAQDIIAELMNTLDFEKGGDIAKQLESLYAFIFDESSEANMNNDTKKIEVCIKILETLYSGWQGAIEQLQKDSANVAVSKKIDVRSR